MNSSYKNDDVIFLLKDVTGLVEPLPSIEGKAYTIRYAL